MNGRIAGGRTRGRRAAARASKDPIAIVVAGAHRSGTSAWTRVLNLLGAALPKTLIGSGPGNERGHWEPARLVNIHDSMFDSIATRWDDWRALDWGRLAPRQRAGYRRQIAGVIGEEFGRSPLMVIKDPRICRLIPFYLPVFTHLSIDARFLIVLRNPLAVAASHGRRDGMTLPFASLLWLAQMLDAERATRHCRRTFASYEHLLADWRAATHHAAKELTISWSGSQQRAAVVDAYLSHELEHFRFSRAELDANTQISAWVKTAYGCFLRLQEHPYASNAAAQLDDLHDRFYASARSLGEAVVAERVEREKQSHKAAGEEAELRATIRSRDSEIAALRAPRRQRAPDAGDGNLGPTRHRPRAGAKPSSLAARGLGPSSSR